MPAIFNDNFWNVEGVQLKKPNLNCLKLDSSTYRMLLLQISDEIGFNSSGIWLVDKDRTDSKFEKFIEIAINEDIALAVTPEYSFPWHKLDDIFQNKYYPSLNNLWVFGMASIRPGELIDFMERNNDIIWIYDRELVNSSKRSYPDRFFDPLCYLFTTNDISGNKLKTIIVQFKNKPFGGADSLWERDNLIKGNTFYVVENENKSAKLVSLICSDTLDDIDFNTVENCKFSVDPMLILHIQLNQKPFADNYKSYRNDIFSKGSKDYQKEVICLNWGRNVCFKDSENQEYSIFNKEAGSALYVKSTKINKDDLCFNRNHRNGMYYTNWSNKYVHVYLLNYDEHIYYIENTKVDQSQDDPSQAKRTGPVLVKAYKWVENAWVENEERIDDGFRKYLEAIEEKRGQLDCLANNENYLDVERLVQFSAGDICTNNLWFRIDKMKSFIIDDSECNDRIVFTQQDLPQKNFERTRKISQYSILKCRIVNDKHNLPTGMDDAYLGYLESLGKYKYLFNIHSQDGKMHATGIYLGSNSRDNAVILQQQIAALFEDNQYGKSVMVWYDGIKGQTRIPEILTLPRISESLEKKNFFITKKGII
ncbi:MAG: hypothetical protein LBF27_02045 [Sphingobacterium sp.]|jgi:hypothetical protein|nr:hypothetical protein [Sphingobacterium sp.]